MCADAEIVLLRARLRLNFFLRTSLTKLRPSIKVLKKNLRKWMPFGCLRFCRFQRLRAFDNSPFTPENMPDRVPVFKFFLNE